MLQKKTISLIVPSLPKNLNLEVLLLDTKRQIQKPIKTPPKNEAKVTLHKRIDVVFAQSLHPEETVAFLTLINTVGIYFGF